jgi:hypothetical protein
MSIQADMPFITDRQTAVIFETCPANTNMWKRNFKDECYNQALRMKDSLKTPFLVWVNNPV